MEHEAGFEPATFLKLIPKVYYREFVGRMLNRSASHAYMVERA